MIVTAYRRDNGQRVRVPAHWLDHPVLGGSFSKTPPSRGKKTVEAVVKKEDADA